MSFGRVCVLGAALAVLMISPARADEGGVSFWLPGQFGSFAATPGEPGLSLPVIYYHTDVDAGGGKEFAIAGSVRAGVAAEADMVFITPTYVFPGKALGGQAAAGLAWAFGTMEGSADVTLTGPKGNVVSRNLEDNITAGSDLYPNFALKWNKGKSNWLAYVMGDIPVGSYEKGRLANMSINHGAIDVGGGYTYLHPDKGHEASATFGLTTNFENPDTDYKNGLDAHLDWAASQFFSKTTHLGIVGYFYDQWTGDSGDGAVLGDFESHVIGLGPEVGHFFPVSGKKWYGQAKAYWEFDAKNRPEGFNFWLILAIPVMSKAQG